MRIDLRKCASLPDESPGRESPIRVTRAVSAPELHSTIRTLPHLLHDIRDACHDALARSRRSHTRYCICGWYLVVGRRPVRRCGRTYQATHRVCFAATDDHRPAGVSATCWPHSPSGPRFVRQKFRLPAILSERPLRRLFSFYIVEFCNTIKRIGKLIGGAGYLQICAWLQPVGGGYDNPLSRPV